ncbi:MAG: hypothetical protein ACK5Y6_00650, partial [Pseudomonadota bacterium]
MIDQYPRVSSRDYNPTDRAQTDAAVQAIVPEQKVITIKVGIDDLEAGLTHVPHLRIRTING